MYVDLSYKGATTSGEYLDMHVGHSLMVAVVMYVGVDEVYMLVRQLMYPVNAVAVEVVVHVLAEVTIDAHIDIDAMVSA